MVIPADELAADAADAAADADLEKVGEAIAELDEDLQPNAIEAVILGEQLADLMDGPAVGQVTVIGADELAADKALADAVAEAELEAEAALEVEPQAEVALDPDAAWAADVRAVEEEIRAASMTDLPEGMAAEPVSDIEFVGFDEPAETEAPAAVADASSFVEPDAEVLDVWVTPEVLGAWREEEPAAQAVASEPSDKDAAPRVAIETQGPDEEFASDAWFATAAPVAESTPAAGSTSVAKPAQVVEANVDGAAQPARAVETVTPAPTPPSARPIENLRDRDAWERAFEEAAAKLGWEEQFEAALRERMTDEGMDRSEAMADLAGDLQGAAPGSDAPATLPPGWASTGTTDAVSRDRIEAEGFSFVAPDLGAHDEPFTDAWSRNGNGHGTDAHAGEDLRLR
jgi:hypothetical protein